MSSNTCYPIELDGAPVYFIDDINSDEESDPEMYSSSSTSSGSTATLTSMEATQYFLEIQGRMFPADANVAINLPQDAAEIQRCLNHHRAFKMTLRSNYWGPVEQVLAPTPGETERKKVLDLVTAEGSWVQEMAQQFPHVDFLTVDNVPLTTHVPRANIVFEVYDFYNGIVAPDEAFDMIHVRQSTAHIRNPQDVVREFYRVLKPGGLLLFVDSELDVFDGKNPKRPAGDKYPGLNSALKLVSTSLGQQGVNTFLWRDLPGWLSHRSELWNSLRESAGGKKQIGFRSIRTKSHVFPTGDWPKDPYNKALGRLAGDTYKGMWRSMEVPLQMYGMEAETANRLIQGAIDDLERPGATAAFKFHTIFAFKI